MPRLLVALDVFSRHEHLRLNVMRLRRELPDATVAAFSNGGDPLLDVDGVRVIVEPVNRGPHNGCRDAGNAFVALCDGHDRIVRMHADSHPIEMDELRGFIDRIREGTVVSANPQPGIRMEGNRAVSTHSRVPAGYVNCHLWGATVADYLRVFPLEVDCEFVQQGAPESGLGIECAIGIRALGRGLDVEWSGIRLVTDNEVGRLRERIRFSY